jgi:hypothetical protein
MRWIRIKVMSRRRVANRLTLGLEQHGTGLSNNIRIKDKSTGVIQDPRANGGYSYSNSCLSLSRWPQAGQLRHIGHRGIMYSSAVPVFRVRAVTLTVRVRASTGIIEAAFPELYSIIAVAAGNIVRNRTL